MLSNSDTGPLYSLIIAAAYFDGFVVVVVAVIIAANFLILKYAYYKGAPFPELNVLYAKSDETEKIQSDEEEGMAESQLIFFRAIFTAWVSPCTVWANNLRCKSYFLPISSVTSLTIHCLTITSIYVAAYRGLDFQVINNFVTAGKNQFLTYIMCRTLPPTHMQTKKLALISFNGFILFFSLDIYVFIHTSLYALPFFDYLSRVIFYKN